MEPTRVGITLDSSVVIAAERRGHSVSEILRQITSTKGDTEIGISVVTIAELMHGAYRANDSARQARRLKFIERLSQDVPVHPVTLEIARLVGRIEGQQADKGIQVAFGDLLIGCTAMQLGYEVATLNLRDFQRIPGLSLARL